MENKRRKRRPDAKRTTLPLGVEDYDVLKGVAEANGWTVAEATRRAVHALLAVDAHIDSMAAGAAGEHGDLLQRIWREVDPALLVRPRNLTAVATDQGAGISVDGELLFLEREGRLTAHRRDDDSDVLYDVAPTGQLVEFQRSAALVPAPQLS